MDAGAIRALAWVFGFCEFTGVGPEDTVLWADEMAVTISTTMQPVRFLCNISSLLSSLRRLSVSKRSRRSASIRSRDSRELTRGARGGKAMGFRSVYCLYRGLQKQNPVSGKFPLNDD